MLKPYKERVLSTYALMQSMIEQAAIHATELIAQRKQAREMVTRQSAFPLNWQVDSTKNSTVKFMGYDQDFKTSDATGLKRMYYNHDKPFTKDIKLFDVFTPQDIVTKPDAYIIPQGWHEVISLLQLNGVKFQSFLHDTIIAVEAYHIDDYKSLPRAYEKHHKNSHVKVSAIKQQIKFLQGDVYVPANQITNRYIVEMLEPTGDDSFFAWNFFDAILQQKEGYSDYRWEDVAAQVLKNNSDLQQKLNDKKAMDTVFASDASAQLDFIYKNSPYYEPAHLRYPVYRYFNH